MVRSHRLRFVRSLILIPMAVRSIWYVMILRRSLSRLVVLLTVGNKRVVGKILMIDVAVGPTLFIKKLVVTVGPPTFDVRVHSVVVRLARQVVIFLAEVATFPLFPP